MAKQTQKIVVAITGASGAIYAQRLIHYLHQQKVDLHIVASPNGKQILREECQVELEKCPGRFYEPDDFKAPFLSGSNRFDAMVIVPCSMGTLGRIAAGTSEGVIGRGADVFLKEKRPLILVPREAPLHLIHLENMARLVRAGALLLPAMPSFYSHPKNIEEAVDTMVGRILDHLGLEGLDQNQWQP